MSSTFQIFSPAQIESLREGGRILADCLRHVSKLVEPGITTKKLDAVAEEFIRSQKGIPAFKGYQSFPATLCISLNDEVVHGIPGPRIIRDGDIVSLDGGVLFDDLYTDACVTVGAGVVTPQHQTFMSVTSAALEDVIRSIVCPGARVGDISAFIQHCLESSGYHPVAGLTGHGLGTKLHQFPDVPNVGRRGSGPMLPVGTMIAIEPIATLGEPITKTDDDAWTIRTKDGSWACHFEHSVLITANGCEVVA